MDTKCVYLYQYKTTFCSTAACAHGAWGGRDVGGPGTLCGAGEGGVGGVLRAINMLLSIFGPVFMLFSCKSRIFFSHLQSAVKKVEKFFRGVNRLS